MWKILFLVFRVGLDLRHSKWLSLALYHSLKFSIEKNIPFLSFLMDLIEKTFLFLCQSAFHLFFMFFSLELLLDSLEIDLRRDELGLDLLLFLFLHLFLRGWWK